MVEAAVEASTRICASSIAYAETRASFARKWREGQLDYGSHTEAVVGFESDWSTFARLSVSNAIAYRAGDLAQRYSLRGYDAVHLATALRFAERLDDVVFIALDLKLVDAARSAGLSIYGE